MKRDYRYQTYGADKDFRMTHAGPVNAPRMSQRVAMKIHRKWLAWRESYLRTHPGPYPLRDPHKTCWLVMHPVDDPQNRQWFFVAAAIRPAAAESEVAA